MTEKAIERDQINFVNDRRGLRLLDPKFQWKYAGLLIAVVVAVAVSLILSFWFYSDQVLATMLEAGVSARSPVYQSIESQMHSLIVSVIAISLFFSLCVFAIGYFASHQIVGPIHALRRSLECLKEGRYAEARIYLRDGDDFQDVAKTVNSIVDRLENKSSH